MQRRAIRYARLSAVDGARLSASNVSGVVAHGTALMGRGKRGSVAVAMSHMAVMREMLRQRLELALVLEDDVEVGRSFLSTALRFADRCRALSCDLLQ